MDSAKLPDVEPGEVSAGLLAADDEMVAPAEDRVAELAYSYWEARGRQGGSPWEDWFRAERDLQEKQGR